MPTILVLDPQPEMRLIMREILEDCGHTVIEAERAAEGLGLINSEDPDLVVMDLNTDKTNCAGALATIREQPTTRDVPIVVISETASIEQMVEVQSIGIQGVIRRPWEYDEVEQTVDMLLSA